MLTFNVLGSYIIFSFQESQSLFKFILRIYVWF